jgi:tetratricopeptide (TPR) repeat protein
MRRQVQSGLTAVVLLLGAAAASATVKPQSEGFEAFYNLEYDRALAIFERNVAREPRNPEAWNHLAQAILYRALYRAGSLEGYLVGRSNAFLARPRATMAPEDEKRFQEAIARSLSLCEERLKANRADKQALYAAGVAYAHRAQYQFLIRKAYMDALRDGTRSRKQHAHLRQIDPDNPDAQLIAGMHEYVTGSLPGWVRAFAFLAGFRGSREAGIAMMEKAAREGQKTGVEARGLLALVYARESAPEKGVPLLAELVAAFPRNYLYRSEHLLLLASAKARPEALEALRTMEQTFLGAAGRMAPEKFAAVRGMAHFRLENWQEAAAAFEEIAQPRQDRWAPLRARAYLYTGQISDLEGQRGKALARYREAIRLAPESETARAAKAGLDRPFRKAP